MKKYNLIALLISFTLLASPIYSDSVCINDKKVEVSDLNGSILYSILNDKIKIRLRFHEKQYKYNLDSIFIYQGVDGYQFEKSLEELSYSLKAQLQMSSEFDNFYSSFTVEKDFEPLLLVLLLEHQCIDSETSYCNQTITIPIAVSDIDRSKSNGEISLN